MAYAYQQTTSVAQDTPAASTSPTQSGGPGNAVAQDDLQRSIYQRAAQDVVDQSNADADDSVWHAMNGGNVGVDKDGASKPDAWFRGIALDGQTPRGVHGDTAGIDDLGEVREMLQSDLSYNDVFEKFEHEDQFQAALLQRYARDLGPGHPRHDQVVAIGRNLWAYGHTGADVDGKTDIAQLQGMLYALDALIAEASQSNTRHKGAFTIPGSDVEVDGLGDGIYGRASILECRLLAALMAEQGPPAPPIEQQLAPPTVEPQPDPGVQTHLIVDFSGSMIKNGHWGRVSELMTELEAGPTRLGTMTDYADDMHWASDDFQDPAAVQKQLQDAESTYNTAFGRHGSPTEARTAVMDSNPDLYAGRSYADESSIHKALEVLRPMEKSTDRRQIVVVSDEKDSRPDELGVLRDMAIEKNVDVQLCFYSREGELFRVRANDVTDELIELLEHRRRAKDEGVLDKGVPAEERSAPGRDDLERLDWKKIAGDPRYVRAG